MLFASHSLTYASKPASFETKITRKSLFLRSEGVFTEQILGGAEQNMVFIRKMLELMAFLMETTFVGASSRQRKTAQVILTYCQAV